MEIDIISVPFSSTGRAGGSAAAPAALHAQGLIGRVREALPTGWTPREPEPVPTSERSLTRGPESGLLNEGALVAMIDGVADLVSASHAAGRLPLLLGGDASILLGGLVAAGHRPAGPTGLLAFGGRERAWPPDASPTGAAADCTIGLALIAHLNAVLAGAPTRRLPLLDPLAVALLGPRDAAELSTAGIPSLAGSITVRSDQELTVADSAQGTAAPTSGQPATEAIELLRATTPSWWLHVDLDVLSTEALSAVEHRQPGGIDWPQLTALTKAAVAEPGLIGWSLSGYDTDLDLDRTSAARIVEYLLAAVSALPPALPADVPEATEPPIATESPDAPESPVATESPIATEPPVATDSPDATEPPVEARPARAVVTLSAETERPTETDRPAETEPAGSAPAEPSLRAAREQQTVASS